MKEVGIRRYRLQLVRDKGGVFYDTSEVLNMFSMGNYLSMQRAKY